MGDMADYSEAVNDWNNNPVAEVTSAAGIGCRYCLAGPLWWADTERGYRLVDEQGRVHKCAAYFHDNQQRSTSE